MTATPRFGATYAPMGAEVEVRDCSVEGELPAALSGGFYAVGPDPQYPLAPGNIAFDGEGHIRLFRIRKGRVDYRSRYVRTERYVAQDAARRNLILALKEDSAPTALDLNTLETVAPVYTFEGQLPRDQPFTAHPKICSTSGNIVAFGYEAGEFGSNIIATFELDRQGRKVWGTQVRMPFTSSVHDFAVTENHIAFFLTPLAIDHEQMRRGGIHWSWDKDKKSYFGFMRRYGDGKDLKWIEGAARGGSHTLGAFEDRGRLYFDRELTAANPYPVIPNKDRTPYDPATGISYLHRLSVNLNGRNSSYDIEQMYPLIAPLPRQDDRYNTVPYRYGFMGCPDPADPVRWKAACYARVDHQTRSHQLWKAPDTVSLGEPLFAPKSADAAEGEGYLLGVAWHLDQNLRADLLVLDAEHIEEGPIATVHLPTQASPQIHGWWVREDQYPAQAP